MVRPGAQIRRVTSRLDRMICRLSQPQYRGSRGVRWIGWDSWSMTSMLVEMSTTRKADAIPRARFRVPKSREIINQNSIRLAVMLSVCIVNALLVEAIRQLSSTRPAGRPGILRAVSPDTRRSVAPKRCDSTGRLWLLWYKIKPPDDPAGP